MITHFEDFWSTVQNRRKFFENYAKKHGFDPFNPENWYNQTYTTILSEKVVRLKLSLRIGIPVESLLF